MSSEIAELTELQRTLYASRNPTRRWLHRSRADRVSALVRETADAGPTNRALEVGPGAGPYMDLLCGLYAEVTASDIEAAHLDYLRKEFSDRHNLTLATDDITASGLEPGFDLILCSEVIEHVSEPSAVLAGIARLLRPGGRLILSTPQPFSTVEVLGRFAFKPGVIQVVRAIYREPVLPTGHVSLLSRRKVGCQIGDAGLVAHFHGLSGLYLPVLAEAGGERGLALARRLEPRLRRGPLSGLLWTQYWSAERPA